MEKHTTQRPLPKSRHQYSRLDRQSAASVLAPINLGLDTATILMLVGTCPSRLTGKLKFLLPVMLCCASCPLNGDELQILKRNPDPYGYPRPAPAATHVPVGTSLFIQLGFSDKKTTDAVLAERVVVRLRSAGSDEVELLSRGASFSNGYTGSIASSGEPPAALAINLDGGRPLRPGTTYTVSVEARSRSGAVLAGDQGSWQFTTAHHEKTHALLFACDLSDKPVSWQGGFFTALHERRHLCGDVGVRR